jgi:hypothetical protein
LIKKYSDKTFSVSERKCSFFQGISEEDLKKKILDFGRKRFEKKVKRFTAEHYFADFDQLIYQGLFESLGYSKNKFQMMQVALKYPFQELKRFKDNGMSFDDMVAILLISSGLSEKLPTTFPTELKTKWLEIYRKQQFNREVIDLNWQLFRLRPPNHPAVRLVQISKVLYDSLCTSLFNRIIRLFSFSADNYSLSLFRKNLYDFFQTAPIILPEKFKLGKSRIDIILINIILPLTVIYAREKNYNELENTALQIYESFPGLNDNFITNYISKYMTNEQKTLMSRKAVFQQGLLNLYYEHCQFHDCDNCI